MWTSIRKDSWKSFNDGDNRSIPGRLEKGYTNLIIHLVLSYLAYREILYMEYNNRNEKFKKINKLGIWEVFSFPLRIDRQFYENNYNGGNGFKMLV